MATSLLLNVKSFADGLLEESCCCCCCCSCCLPSAWLRYLVLSTGNEWEKYIKTTTNIEIYKLYTRNKNQLLVVARINNIHRRPKRATHSKHPSASREQTSSKSTTLPSAKSSKTGTPNHNPTGYQDKQTAKHYCKPWWVVLAEKFEQGSFLVIIARMLLLLNSSVSLLLRLFGESTMLLWCGPVFLNFFF